MNLLGEPVSEQQRELLTIIWKPFIQDGQLSSWQYVDLTVDAWHG